MVPQQGENPGLGLGYSSAAERWPSMGETLSSIPNTAKNRREEKEGISVSAEQRGQDYALCFGARIALA